MDRKAFFDHCRADLMAPSLDGDEVSGTEAILDAMAGTPLSWCAYALATAWHETAHTMQPIRELGGRSYLFRMYDPGGNRPALAKSMGNTEPGDGVKYCGRGLVQLTWKANYARAEKQTGHPLIAQPDLALQPAIAAQIMRSGMEEGWFTGRSFNSFLPKLGPADEAAFINARRIINGSDRAGQIAGYALQFQTALKAGGWS